MRVYIVRHGKAEPYSESGLDRDRRLAERGEQQAAWLSGVLGEEASGATVVASDAARARATAEALARGVGAEVQFDARLRVDEPVSGVMAVIRERSEADRAGAVCVVGHNPQLASAIALLTQGVGSPEVRLRTGEAWAIEVDDERPIGTGRVLGVHRLDD